jgi:hypothetical protein
MCEWRDWTPPLPFARKRFAAPRFVFSFGMTISSLFSLFQRCLDWAGGSRSPHLRCGDREHLFVSMADRLASTRTDHHDHLLAFHERLLLDGANLQQILLHALEQRCADLLVHHLASAEAQCDFRLVTLL